MKLNTPPAPRARSWQALVVAAGLCVGTAQAQNPAALPPEVESRPDVLQFGVGLDIEHHSNLFAVPNGKSDTALSVPLTIGYRNDFGGQKLRLQAGATPVKYLDNSRFDYVGFDAGGVWDIEVGRLVFGSLEARFQRFRTPFEASFENADNLEERLLLRALAGIRFTPSWSVFGALERSDLSNSASVMRQNDYVFDSYELGLRYQPGNAMDLDFFYRRADGNFPNRQVLDANGNVLPGGVDNNFEQDALLARLTYRPSEETRITGVLGFTDRSYGTLPERDFSGVTLGLEAVWPWSGAVRMRLNLIRDIVPEASLSANYAEIQRVAFSPEVLLTGRLTLVPLVSWERRLYEGDPGFVVSGQAPRRDTLTRLGLEGRYEYARNIFLSAYFWNLKRSSNYANYEFTDTVIGSGVRVLF